MLDETNKAERIIDSLRGYFSIQNSSFEGAFLANENKIKLNFFDKLLHFTPCSVMLLAANHKPAKEIIFVYDGSMQSVNAIKTFIYLMPEYLLKSNVFLYVLVNERSIEEEKKW